MVGVSKENEDTVIFPTHEPDSRSGLFHLHACMFVDNRAASLPCPVPHSQQPKSVVFPFAGSPFHPSIIHGPSKVSTITTINYPLSRGLVCKICIPRRKICRRMVLRSAGSYTARVARCPWLFRHPGCARGYASLPGAYNPPHLFECWSVTCKSSQRI